MIKIKSIKIRIIGLISALGLILSIFLAVVAPWQARDLAQDILSDNARLFGKVLAADLVLGMQAIILDDGAAIAETLDGLRPDGANERFSVSDAWVYSKSGKLIAALNDKTNVPPVNRVSEYTLSDLDNVFRMSAPLRDKSTEPTGYLTVDLSKEYFLSQTASNRSRSLLLALGAMILSLVGGYLLARSIGRPLVELTQAAEQVVTGDVDLHLTVRSDDELGRLTKAFQGLIEYIRDVASVAERIARNDLTVRIKPKSEKDILGHAFSNMIANLRGIIETLRDSVTVLAERADEISHSAEQMSEGTRMQVDQFGQVGGAIEEMTATIIQSSKNAAEARDGAKKASDTANIGGQIVGESIQGMQNIANVMAESAESIKQLAGSAHQIGDIVRVIEDIADQTNLLALNAAIEAARAGEQGRGFAVVADEVRKLAERTAKATGEITGKIKRIQKETDQAVKSMDAGLLKVEEGRTLADKAGDSLNEIVVVSQQVMDMIQQIATAAEQQSVTAEELSRNVDSVAGISQTSAAEAKKSADVAEQLNQQAFELNEIVSRFKLNA